MSKDKNVGHRVNMQALDKAHKDLDRMQDKVRLPDSADPRGLKTFHGAILRKN